MSEPALSILAMFQSTGASARPRAASAWAGGSYCSVHLLIPRRKPAPDQVSDTAPSVKFCDKMAVRYSYYKICVLITV